LDHLLYLLPANVDEDAITLVLPVFDLMFLAATWSTFPIFSRVSTGGPRESPKLKDDKLVQLSNAKIYSNVFRHIDR
jgi:hypothetical protein